MHRETECTANALKTNQLCIDAFTWETWNKKPILNYLGHDNLIGNENSNALCQGDIQKKKTVEKEGKVEGENANRLN